MTDEYEQKLDIHELKYRYCHYTDQAAIDEFVDIFTDDARFDIGVYGTGQGRADIREFIEWVDQQPVVVRAHNVFNPRIEIDGDHATGEWYYIAIYEHEDGRVELGQGRYQDEYRVESGEWKISALTAKRIVTRDL